MTPVEFTTWLETHWSERVRRNVDVPAHVLRWLWLHPLAWVWDEAVGDPVWNVCVALQDNLAAQMIDTGCRGRRP